MPNIRPLVLALSEGTSWGWVSLPTLGCFAISIAGAFGFVYVERRAEAPLVDRMAVEAAMALTDVIRMKELARLEICAAEDCNDVLVDLSKNRSRRFCSTACSNRTNMAAFRARKSQG